MELHFTPIFEKARRGLGLTRDEYALCHYIQTWASHPDNFTPGWCNRSKSQIADWIGITRKGVQKMINRMTDEGLLLRSADEKYLKVTAKWFQMVNLAKNPIGSSATDDGCEQSTQGVRTKYAGGCEQSTQGGANKVRTHNKYNSNNNNYTPPTSTHARAKDFSEFSADSESAPPSPQPPSPAGGWMESLKSEIETNTDAWLLAMKRLGVKRDKSGLLELLDEFDAHVRTDKREYQAETEYRRHFKSWAAKATEIQADKSEKASEKARKASPKKGINDATVDMDRPQLI